MTATTLEWRRRAFRYYAADADAGVSLQDSHWEWRLGLGRSLTGKYEKTGDSEPVTYRCIKMSFGIQRAGVERYILDCPITKQDFAMESGLRRDSSAHHWYTTDIKIAARLAQFAEGALRERLNAVAAQSSMKPTLAYERGLYIFRAERGLAELARDAEFFRNPETGDWYTTDPNFAMRLSAYGDESCHSQIRASLAEMEAALEASCALDADIEIPAPTCKPIQCESCRVKDSKKLAIEYC